MRPTVSRRPDGKFDVDNGGHWVAGPFHTAADAEAWIKAQISKPKLVIDDDVRRIAKEVEGAYMARIAQEDLAYLIGAVIMEERRRCIELTLSMSNALVESSGGLMRRPTFSDLATKMREGRQE